MGLFALFLSGFSALVYELCWIRMASLVFGSTVAAVSTVLASFFGGLAIGSFAFGRLAQSTQRPLRWYCGLEIGLCGLALISPLMFDVAEQVYVYVSAGDQSVGAMTQLLIFALVGAVLLPPTILMGGTLPLFCRAIAIDQVRVTRITGILYGVNTLGAATGCWVAGMVLIPKLGVDASIHAAAVITCLAAVLVAWIAWQDRAEPTSFAKDKTTEPTMRAGRIGLLFFGVGFVALGSEVFWVRFLKLLIRNSVHTYTITLTFTLLGIVLRSLLVARMAEHRVRPAALFA